MKQDSGFPDEVAQSIEAIERAMEQHTPAKNDEDLLIRVEYRALRGLLDWLKKKREEFDLIHEMTERLKELHPNSP